MRQIIASMVLMIALSGCAFGPLSLGHKAPAITPTQIAQVPPTPTPSPTAAVSSAETRALQDYACAIVPVASDLKAASSAYADAQGAVASDLMDSARLDMDDAVGDVQRAQAELRGLQPPPLLAYYQEMLADAAGRYLDGARALRGDYASSNLSAAKADGASFQRGDSYLARAEQERKRVNRQVSLPDESSPVCSQTYLREFLAHRHLVASQPHPTATPRPKKHPASVPTSRPKPAPTASKRSTSAPARPTIRPLPTPPAISAAERRYIHSASKVLNHVYSATTYLRTAYEVLARNQNVNTTPLIDHATRLLNSAGEDRRGLHAPSVAFRSVDRQMRSAITADYTAARKLRLTVIDLFAANVDQSRADMHYAYLALKSSIKQTNAALKTLRTRVAA